MGQNTSVCDHTSCEQLIELGWGEPWSTALSLVHRPPGARPGRVVRVDHTQATVMTCAGAQTVRAVNLVVGDWVLLDKDALIERLPRANLLTRATVDRTSTQQQLAANVDCVMIVEPCHPKPKSARIQRFLALAYAADAEPLVVLTKADLANDADIAAVRDGLPGTSVCLVSAATGQGIPELRAGLRGGTFVLLGPSGAGKSTLVNALNDTEVSRTGAVRTDGKGRHTTTHRELFVVPGLGCWIDTPGLRSVGLDGDCDAVDAVFTDVTELLGTCKYRNCSHTGDAGCALQQAVRDGDLSASRLDQYLKLQREAAHAAARADAFTRSTERRDKKSRQYAKAVIMRAKGRRN